MNSQKLIGTGALALMLLAGVASAQTTDMTYTGTDTVDTAVETTSTMDATGATGTSGSVGVPNTGAGGDTAVNAMVLATTGAVALGGLYLLRRRSF